MGTAGERKEWLRVKRLGRTTWARRGLSGILAALLCLFSSLGALAAEPSGSAVSEEPALESSDASSETESAGTLFEGDAEEVAFAAAPLLVTGGHNTYMNGYAGALFKPEASMTRAETAQMLYNLLAAKPPVSESKFSDVALNKWYGTAVNALAESGVLSGYKDGTFLPNNTITRAEFVTALTRCFSLEEGSASFTDVPETHWAYKYIAQGTTAGWIHGVGDSLFQPDRGIKRCEAVTVMNAALGRKDSGFAADRNTQKFKDVPKTHWAFLEITEAAQPVEQTEPDPGPNAGFEVGQTVIVVASALNLREGPGTDYKSVLTLPNGTTLTVTDVSNDPWLGVKTAAGKTGYVHAGSADDPYVENYVPGQAAGAKLSTSTLTLRQYESARLDASVSSGLSSMSWTSSDPSVAVVGYTINYKISNPITQQGAIVYGKKPGTATLTFSDEAGKTKASCTVTVGKPLGVRFGYADVNSAVSGQSFNLVAVTDTTRSQVTFSVTGPVSASYTSTTYKSESRKSTHGLPDNNVHVFTQKVTFSATGNYTIRASAPGSTETCVFQAYVGPAAGGTTAVSADHRISNEMLSCIANFEGSVPEVEDDRISPKHPTVGYGYVVPVNTSFYNTLTETELWAMLVDKVNTGNYGRAVNNFRSKNDIKMSQAQFDALTSFVYNLGPGNLSPEFGFCRVMLNAAAPPSASASAPVAGVLNVEDADILDQPSLSGKKVITAPQGKSVSIIGSQILQDKKQVWYQVKYDNKTGWIPAGYVNISGSACDLTYADSTVLANHILQWCTSNSRVYAGLVYRRLAECKVFFFGNYTEARHYNEPSGNKNTYGFNFPDICADYDYAP